MGMLTGKITVITGGTSGIGAAAARLFAAEGATVVIAGRRKDEGDRLAAELSLMAAEGATAEFVRTDVSAEADVQALTGHVTDRFGRLDCLVNNAGTGGTPGGVAAVEMTLFWQTLAVNLGGVVLGMKHARSEERRVGKGCRCRWS